jgi:peptide/nickel transport system permease protein
LVNEILPNIPVSSEALPKASKWKRFWRVFIGRRLVAFGAVVIIVFLLLAIFGPLIAPYNPNQFDLTNALSPPSTTHLLGTDQLGRDTLSRIIYGARISLMIGLAVVVIGFITGGTLGLIAGYFGGWAFMIIMRLMDAIMSIPMIFMVLGIAAMLGGGMTNVIVALSVGMLPGYARLMCGQVLTVKENDYVMASRSLGASNYTTMFRHVLPNCFAPFIVVMTMMLGMVILAEAGLSFLGVGIKPPTAAWGSMINDSRPYLTSNPVLSLAPGFALMLIVYSFNMVGDGLRDAVDPRLRGTF